jgi:hypothetical protein
VVRRVVLAFTVWTREGFVSLESIGFSGYLTSSGRSVGRDAAILSRSRLRRGVTRLSLARAKAFDGTNNKASDPRGTRDGPVARSTD